MRDKLHHLILFVIVTLSVGLIYGQGSLGPIPKKPRTVEDYKPGTLREIVVGTERDGLLPFRVRVTYKASARPISAAGNNTLHDWARCCAGNPDHYKGYIREMQFVENGLLYWLAVEDRLKVDLATELKVGDSVDLFVIRLRPPATNGKGDSILLVERFERVTNSDQMKETLDWIKSNLPSYAEKELDVEVSGPCQLKITDSSKSASVSRAVVFVPLNDLDFAKVSVEPQGEMWRLWLRTTAGKSSIRFMLYQGSAAEGGQATEHSLTIRDRKRAEAMAEAFRRAINLC